VGAIQGRAEPAASQCPEGREGPHAKWQRALPPLDLRVEKEGKTRKKE
jgi:hypothetical protein